MTEPKKVEINGLARLLEPFAPNEINKLPKPLSKDSTKGRCPECQGWHGLPALHLDYVGHAALTKRLLQVDPLWSWEPVAFDDNGLPQFDGHGGLWIRLTICNVTRLGYGDASGKTGPNAIKEAIGDALRNAGMRFGAALDLWHKGDLFENNDAQGTVEAPASPKEVELVEHLIASVAYIMDTEELRSLWARNKALLEVEFNGSTLKDTINNRVAFLKA